MTGPSALPSHCFNGGPGMATKLKPFARGEDVCFPMVMQRNFCGFIFSNMFKLFGVKKTTEHFLSLVKQIPMSDSSQLGSAAEAAGSNRRAKPQMALMQSVQIHPKLSFYSQVAGMKPIPSFEGKSCECGWTRMCLESLGLAPTRVASTSHRHHTGATPELGPRPTVRVATKPGHCRDHGSDGNQQCGSRKPRLIHLSMVGT